ncbi:hypothetical protein [Aliarcobacter cryaerophilus]|uniref:hypothetical protein n=1 Tax=Aliarcobacter cryaerophilus TaxID=28198 RepID=UPI0021B3E87C|nr:hypothetical protein [Aliarcobacter cryaerophilus]MCT7464911.1 hypothetical protein [Aliarcobacter cryaerophilus]
MKKISLYTNLKRDYEKMKNSLIDYDLKNIENREELLTLKENLIIYKYRLFIKNTLFLY